ncbi:MAG: hypothetical protein DHS20C10_07450 [marine bacterium B5-7]|nr:MAG: hypothetical protein DHS20C10_07450 [marine bacterium B5-7]
MPFNSNNDDTARLAQAMTNAVLDDPASDTSEKCDEHVDNDFREIRIEALLEKTGTLSTEEQKELESLLTQQDKSSPASPVRRSASSSPFQENTASHTPKLSLKDYLNQLTQEKKQRDNYDTSTPEGKEATVVSLICSLSIFDSIFSHKPVFTDLTPERRDFLAQLQAQLLADLAQRRQAIKNVQTPAAGELSPFFTDRHAEQFPTPSEAAGKGPKRSAK